ncbi:MAG: glycosyltransferase family 39 protein [Anaerolineae bacterium]|nr:glycosyltransferase family 39 protein [Anaerolineae bacterium]
MSHRRLWLLLFLILYVLLAFGYSIISPIFETPDEHHHYFTIQAIKSDWKLPVASAKTLARQEAAQPPLYYLLAAILTSPLEGDKASLQMNPYHPYNTHRILPEQNRNLFIHTPIEYWPWQGYVLSVHVIRLFSISLGIGTLLCIYASGRLLWPLQPTIALVATGLIAFLPQFLFIQSAVSNDSLIIFMSAVVLWQLIRIWQKGGSTASLIVLGITIGIAILSKMTGLLLLVYAVGTLVLLAWRNGRWRDSIKNSMLVIMPALLVAGWLFWRNWVLYGDPTATNQFVALAGGQREYTLRQVWNDMDRVWKSLFAYFGWMTIEAPSWVYSVWQGLIWGSFAGFFFSLYQKRDKLIIPFSKPKHGAHVLQQPWFLAVWLASWCLLVIFAWLQFMMQTSADQGRLWFPALLPAALGLAYGLAKLPKGVGIIGGPLLAFITAVYCLFGLIAPTYAAPEVITLAEIPSTAARINVDMGHGLTLLAVDTETKTAVPGDTLYATFYWQASAPPTNSPIINIVGTGRNFVAIANLETLPGSGINPPFTWKPDQVIADRLAIKMDENTVVPARIRLWIELKEGTEKLEFGQIKAVPENNYPIQSSPLAVIGNSIQLSQANLQTTQAQPGETVQVQFQWQVLTPPGKALTAFVHLGSSDAPPLAQTDAPPLNGDFPTEMWEAGDTIDDVFTITLPENIPFGEYPLYTGLYDSVSGTRMPLTVDGESQPNHVFLIGTLQINPVP